LFDAAPVQIAITNVVLSPSPTGLRSLAIVPYCFGEVFSHPRALIITIAQVYLGLHEALVRSLGVEAERLGRIRLHPFAQIVAIAKIVRATCQSPPRRPPQLRHGGLDAFLDASP